MKQIHVKGKKITKSQKKTSNHFFNITEFLKKS